MGLTSTIDNSAIDNLKYRKHRTTENIVKFYLPENITKATFDKTKESIFFNHSKEGQNSNIYRGLDSGLIKSFNL